MKNLLQRFSQKNLRRLSWLLVIAAVGFLGSPAAAQITGTTPASRCGEGELTLHATASNGTITWYAVPFYGTPVETGGTFITPVLPVTTTYYVDAVDANGCSLNAGSVRVPVIATISANSIQAAIFYESPTFCTSTSDPQYPTRTGTAGGVYTASPATGLSLNASTGAIIPSTSAIGTYTVTYTVEPAPGCIENPASTTVTITSAPVQPVISYSGSSPYCTTHAPLTVTQTGATGGTYSASPTGLTIHAATGTITLSSSQAGTYTITYFVSGAGGCTPMTATTSLTVTAAPMAAISYTGNPFCKSISSAMPVTMTGSGAYTGGAFSYTGAGTLSLNTSSGAVTPSTSTSGAYTVTYTIPASGGCAAVPVTTPVTINPLPTASISGTTTVCQGNPSPEITFTGANGTPPYTFTYNVNGGSSVTVSTTGESSTVNVAQSTVSGGTFTYTLESVADANDCSQSAEGTATITVVTSPVATFTYPGSPYCQTGTALPSFTGGGTAGTFSSTAGLVFVSTATGEVNLATSTPGTYTVTNTIASCGGVQATADITINALPTASISGTLTACVTTTLTASTDAGTPVYEWYLDDVLLAGEVNATLAATASGSYKVKVTNSTTGCSKFSSAVVVTIHPLPVVSISGNDQACVSTVLTAVNNATTPSFVWYKDDVVIDGETDATLTVTASGSYKVKVTDGTTTCENTTASLAVTIFPQPTATIAGTVSVCIGANSPDITFTGSNGSAPYTFTYNINGGSNLTVSTAAGESTVTVAAPTTTAGDYIYTLTKVSDGSILACDKTITGQSATVTVVADPVLTQPGNATFCKGGTATLTTSASGGVGSYSYQWQYSADGETGWANVADNTPAGIAYSGATTVSLVITGDGSETAQANYYRCTVTAGSGCDGATSAVTVTVVNDPAWDSYTFPVTSITYGGSVTFSVGVVNGLGGSIAWVRSTTIGGTGTTVTSPDTPPSNGTFYYRPVYTPTGSGCNLSDGTETTVTVAQKELTVNGMVGVNKVYDGTTDATFTGSPVLNGAVSGDVVSLTGTPVANFVQAEAGIGLKINVTGLSLTGADAGKYTLTVLQLSADITQLSLSITGLTGNNKVYDRTTAATFSGTAALSGIVSPDVVTLTGTPVATFRTNQVTEGAKIDVTGYALDGADKDNYTLEALVLNGNITPLELSVIGIAGDNKEYDGGTTATFSGLAELSGVIIPDVVTLGGTPVATFRSASLGTGIKIDVTGYTLGGANSANYSLAAPVLNGNITQKQLTIVDPSLSLDKIYDATTTADVEPGALIGIVGTEVVTVSAAADYDDANIGTGKDITVVYTIGGADAGNYIKPVDYVVHNGIIDARELDVINAVVTSRAYNGTTDAAITGATLSGVVGTEDVILGDASAGTFSQAEPGTDLLVTTAMTISGTDAGNYTLIQPELYGDITEKQLTIGNPTITLSKVYDGNTTAAVTAGTLSGVVSGDEVILTTDANYGDANVGTGKTITVVYSISGADAYKYLAPADYVVNTGVITAKALTVVSAWVDTREYDGTTAAYIMDAMLDGVVGGDLVDLDNSNSGTFAQATPANDIAIATAMTISGLDEGNYTLTQPTLTGNIIPKLLSISSPDLTTSKTYDGTTTAAVTAGTLSGVVGSEVVTVTAVANYDNANIGENKTITVVYTLGGADADNYSRPLNDTVTNGVITPAAPTGTTPQTFCN